MKRTKYPRSGIVLAILIAAVVAAIGFGTFILIKWIYTMD